MFKRLDAARRRHFNAFHAMPRVVTAFAVFAADIDCTACFSARCCRCRHYDESCHIAADADISLFSFIFEMLIFMPMPRRFDAASRRPA